MSCLMEFLSLLLLWVRNLFSLTSFKIFSMSMVFCILNMICLGVHFLIFIFLGIFWASSIYSLKSIINFENFLAINNLIISSALFSLFFLAFPSHKCYTFWYPHNSLMSCFCFFILFSFCIFFSWKFLLTYLQVRWFFSSSCLIYFWAHWRKSSSLFNF